MVPAVKGTARPTRHPHRAGVTRIVVGKLRDEGAIPAETVALDRPVESGSSFSAGHDAGTASGLQRPTRRARPTG